MRNMKMITAAAAACVMASAILLSGCGSKTAETTAAAAETTAAGTETTAAGTETTAAGTEETTAAGDAAAETVAAADVDALAIVTAISEVSPKRPDDLGTVTLGAYTDLDLTATKAAQITDTDVDNYITANILPNYPMEVNDEVKEGDTATINFVGSIDGVEFEGGKGEDYPLVIGSGAFIPGFEDQLIGAQVGETVDVNVTFPEDYGAENLAGKAALFVVDINKIERPRDLAHIDDDFVNEVTQGEYTNLADFREMLRTGLQTYNDTEAKEGLADAVLSTILANSEVKPSEDAVEWQTDIYITTYDAALTKAYGMSLASMIQMYGQTYEEFRDGLTEGATEAASRAAVVYEIAQKEGLTVTDEAKEQYAEEFGYTDVNALAEATSESELELAVLSNLVTNFVAEHSNVTYTEAAAEVPEE